jgi:hypothetical protein
VNNLSPTTLAVTNAVPWTEGKKGEKEEKKEEECPALGKRK